MARPPATDRDRATPRARDESSRQRLLDTLKGRVFRASDLLASDAATADAALAGNEAARACSSSRELPGDDAAEPRSLFEIIPQAERFETPAGPTTRVVRRFPLDEIDDADSPYAFPGRAAALDLSGAEFAILAHGQDVGGLAPRDLVFLDTETTGLAGGTGTYVFLIGLGWYEANAFVVEQWFMEDYDGERALMAGVAARLRQFRGFVTYNGRNFDVPLLRTRFLFTRVAHALDEPDIDLLYPARRVWREALSRCALSTLEERVLRLPPRRSDVPGFLVPRIFMDYARGVRRERVVPVFDHNAQDILSLASLLGLMGAVVRDPAVAPLGHPLEALGAGRLLERAGRTEAALERLERALLIARDPRLEFLISCRIARLYRKNGRRQDAADIWASHVARPQPWNLAAFEELAKHCEHGERDLARAADLTRRALAWCEGQAGILEALGREAEARPLAIWIARLRKRLDRLERRLAARGG